MKCILNISSYFSRKRHIGNNIKYLILEQTLASCIKAGLEARYSYLIKDLSNITEINLRQLINIMTYRVKPSTEEIIKISYYFNLPAKIFKKKLYDPSLFSLYHQTESRINKVIESVYEGK